MSPEPLPSSFLRIWTREFMDAADGMASPEEVARRKRLEQLSAEERRQLDEWLEDDE